MISRGRAFAVVTAARDTVKQYKGTVEPDNRGVTAVVKGMVEGYKDLSDSGLHWLVPSKEKGELPNQRFGFRMIPHSVSAEVGGLLQGVATGELKVGKTENGSYLSGNGLAGYPGQLLSLSVLEGEMPDGVQFVALGGVYGNAWQIVVPTPRERPQAPRGRSVNDG